MEPLLDYLVSVPTYHDYFFDKTDHDYYLQHRTRDVGELIRHLHPMFIILHIFFIISFSLLPS